APPRIYPNYLSAETDLEEMLAGVRFLRKLAGTPSFSAVIAAELKPGAEGQSRADLIADIRQRSGTIFHPVGTCTMGPDPSRTVVDTRLRGHGIAGLRVIDASIFPNVTSGNTNAPTIMVGEKGSAMVLEDAASAGYADLAEGGRAAVARPIRQFGRQRSTCR